jgi:hexosaminidase
MRNFHILLFITLTANAAKAQLCPIIPHPTTYITTGGSIVLKELISVNKKKLPTFGEDILKWYFTHDLGINTIFINDGGQVAFKRLSNVPSDFYSIDVKENITISYSSEASCFYALQSLKQLIQIKNGVSEIPQCFISDQPRFAWRGMHLDVSRHFFTVEEVKKYLDWMARYKFNTFHWHLTDDQGWRIEIKAFPKLTEIGSVRAQTRVGHASTKPEKYDGIPEKGFYTQAEIKEVVKYASKLFIDVVPEIEMPGHARAALAAYPEFSCDGKTTPVAQTWGVFNEIFCSKDTTIKFLQAVLSEVVMLFPGKYIHIGGDEAPKTNWKTCLNCQAQIQKNGLKDEAELQSYFIRQMDAFLTSKGKTLIGWDEILEGGLSENAAVMSWRGTKGGIEAAEQHHYVVMTPGSHCYFDHYQSDRKSEPLAIGGFTSLEKVYSFNPIPEELPTELNHFILGAQANLWTEYIADWKQVEYMILPRMIALSEVLWTQGEKDYPSFLERLVNYEMPYMDSKKINYSKAAFYLEAELVPDEKGIELLFEGIKKESKIDLEYDKKNKTIIREKNGKLRILKTNRPHLLKFSARTKTKQGSDTLGVEILQHRTLGQPWTIETALSQFYPGKGGLTLSDGIIGSRPWNGKEWLGFDSKEVKMSIELDQKQKLNGINLSFLQAESSWIHLPEKVQIDYSKNGRRWKSKEFLITKEFHRFVINRKAKFIRLSVISTDTIPEGLPGSGHAPWLFMDEVYFD